MCPKNRDLPWLKTRRERLNKPVRVSSHIVIPGFGTITRAGRAVQIQSVRTTEEHAALTARFAAEHGRVVAEIQAHVEALSDLVPKFDPLELLKRAYIELFLGMLGKEGEHEVDAQNSRDLRVLEYVQVVIVARPPSSTQPPPKDDDWNRIRGHVEGLFAKLLHPWPSTDTASRTTAGTLDPSAEKFRVPLLLEWISVRGSAYNAHLREKMAALLEPHNAELQVLFGASGATLSEALERVLRNLTHGIRDAMATACAIHKQVFSEENLLGFVPPENATEADTVRALVARCGREEELHEALGKAYGVDLFKVTSLFPRNLLEGIALAPGDDTSFYQHQEYPGWPLRALPTTRYPVLKIGSEFYIFSPFCGDSFYRAIQRAVLQAHPAYADEWNKGQKLTTEEIPVQLLSKLLPGAQVFRDVEYPAVDGTQRKWCECDAVLILDGFLIAVEVKAGRPTDSSPWEDLQAHVRNVSELLVAPTVQAERFLQYLDSANEVPIYRKGGKNKRIEVARLQREAVHTRLRCAVTADSLASVAGLFQHEEFVTSGRTIAPSWCLSIDDLYAYRDIIPGPISFFHFITERLRAFSMPQLARLDELDHLGAYLRSNAYTKDFERLDVHAVALLGYRAQLDKFFAESWFGDRPSHPPMQRMPPVIAELIQALEKAHPRDFLRVGSSILAMDDDSREVLSSSIHEFRSRERSHTTGQLLTMVGSNCQLFVALSLAATPQTDWNNCREIALAQLLRTGADEAPLALVGFDSHGIADVGCEIISVQGLASSELERLRALSSATVAVRFAKAQRDGVKIGRNEKCLCGSGKKFKRCCERPLKQQP